MSLGSSWPVFYGCVMVTVQTILLLLPVPDTNAYSSLPAVIISGSHTRLYIRLFASVPVQHHSVMMITELHLLPMYYTVSQKKGPPVNLSLIHI